MAESNPLSRDLGTKFVVAGCGLGTLSLVLPYAVFGDAGSAAMLSPESLTGIRWQLGKVYLFVLGVTVLVTYLVRWPRVRAVWAAIAGGLGVSLPLLLVQVGVPTPNNVSSYRPGVGTWVASIAGAVILLGALYWWVRPDRSYPDGNLPSPEEAAR